jgi:hypothetical protein
VEREPWAGTERIEREALPRSAHRRSGGLGERPGAILARARKFLEGPDVFMIERGERGGVKNPG